MTWYEWNNSSSEHGLFHAAYNWFPEHDPVTGTNLLYNDTAVENPSAADPPMAGEVYAIGICDTYGSGYSAAVSEFVDPNWDGNWSWSSLTIGDATHHGDSVYLDNDFGDYAGSPTITLYGGSNIQTSLPYSALTIKDDGIAFIDYDTVEVAKSIVVEAGGTLAFTSEGYLSLLAATDPLLLAGTLDLTDGYGMDCDLAPIKVTADGAAIHWDGGTINGGLNANGKTVTHSNTTNAYLMCDVPGILALGAAVPDLIVQIAPGAGQTVTLGENLVASVSMLSGTLALDGKSVTGEFRQQGGTVTGAGSFVLGNNEFYLGGGVFSVTGPLTLTMGSSPLTVGGGNPTEITCQINAMLGTGGLGGASPITFSGAGTVNATVPAGVTCPVNWWDSATPLPSLTVAAGATANGGTLYARSITVNGALTCSGSLEFYPTADEFLVYGTSGVLTANNYLKVHLASDRSVSEIKVTATHHDGTWILGDKGADRTLTCNTLSMPTNSILCNTFIDGEGTGSGKVTLSVGSLTTYSIRIGGTTTPGGLVLRPGKHDIKKLYGTSPLTTHTVIFQTGAVVLWGNQIATAENFYFARLAVQLNGASFIARNAESTFNGANAVSFASAGAHVHNGIVKDCALDAANPLYRFGSSGSDTGNGAGVIKMPAPASGSCVPMAA